VTTALEEKSVYRAGFDRLVASSAAGPEWLRERRVAAFGRFVEKGFPGPRDEAWRHTPIAPITRTRWEVPEPSAGVPGDLAGRVPSMGDRRVVLVDGRLSPELSSPGPEDAGVEIYGLRELLESRPERLEPLLGRVQGTEASAFADLNEAFAADGVVVLLAPGAVVEEPLHVAHVATAPGPASVSHSRVLVVAGRGSQGRIVESFTGPEGVAYLTNAVTEIVVEDNASVDHCKLQQEGAQGYHLATMAARLGRDARLADHAFSFGAAISRNDIDVRFAAEGGDCVLDGLFMVDGDRLTDTHSRVDHAMPHCSSRELYKGVLDGRSRGVFNALILVRPGAQKTDAEQMNRNLLLSGDALVHSVPQLEILADDVKCRHGSTTGQLDPEAMFYLRSRGIGESEARALLTWAFAADLVHGLFLPSLRHLLEGVLESRLKGAGHIKEAIA
jgi:Fe-S cluster assembly protein SufD